MATLRKRKGKWTVSIRKKSIRPVYQTFDLKSDARSFISKVESDTQYIKDSVSDIRYDEGMKKVILIVVAGLLWSNTVFSVVSLTEGQI